MRSSKLIFAGGLTLLAVFGILLGGCSDDKTATTGSNSIIHSQYDETMQQVNAFIDSTLSVFNTGLNINYIGNDVMRDTATSQVIYTAVEPDSVVVSNFWYLVYNSDIDLGAGYSNVTLDSIRFLRNGNFQDSPKNADVMNIRHNWNYEILDTSASFCNYANYGDITFYNVDTDTVTVSGSTNLQVVSKTVDDYNTARSSYDIQTTISNLKTENIKGDNNFGCPYSGTIICNVELNYEYSEGQYDVSNWVFNFSFENGVAEVVVTQGARSGNYTCDFCDFNQ